MVNSQCSLDRPKIERILDVHRVVVVCQEIYSIKLPGPVILGESKPENQNHAIIFTRGDALQTIDMNQVDFNFVTYERLEGQGVMLAIHYWIHHFFYYSKSNNWEYLSFLLIDQSANCRSITWRKH
jgi:hypothetical protein